MFADTTLRSPTVSRRRRGSSPAPLHADTGAPRRRRRWAIAGRPGGERVGSTAALTLGPAWQISALRTLYGA